MREINYVAHPGPRPLSILTCKNFETLITFHALYPYMGQKSHLPDEKRRSSKESAELDSMRREREHVEMENALRTIEQLACDGIEQFDVDSKDAALREIRNEVAEVFY